MTGAKNIVAKNQQVLSILIRLKPNKQNPTTIKINPARTIKLYSIIELSKIFNYSKTPPF